jgi:hypothetical protein
MALRDFQDLFYLGYGTGLEYLLAAHSPWRRSYFIFVEESASLNGTDTDTPEGGKFEPVPPKVQGSSHRLRASGVDARDFLRRSRDFEDLPQGPIEPRQRATRLDQLGQYFAENPVHRFDIYLQPEDEEARSIRHVLTATSWNLIILGAGKAAMRRPVVHASTADWPDTYKLQGLRRILRIPPAVEMRLRDIFSLNHVGDADLGDEGIGETSGPFPPPVKPISKQDAPGWQLWHAPSGG